MPKTAEVVERLPIPSNEKALDAALDKFLQRHVYYDKTTKKRVGSAFLRKILHDREFADECLTEEAKGELDGRIGEVLDKYLKNKRVEEIKADRRYIIEEQKRLEENRKRVESLRLKQEEELHNPTITLEEASKILGVSPMTVILWAKKGKIQGVYHKGCGWWFKRNYVVAYRRHVPYERRGYNNITKAIDKQRNDTPEDPYMTAGEVARSGLLPLTKRSIKNYVKRGLIQYKIVYLDNRRVHMLRVKHIHALKNKPPKWLKKALQWHKYMTGDGKQ